MGTSLNHIKKMDAEPGRRFLKQLAVKLELVLFFFETTHCCILFRCRYIHRCIRKCNCLECWCMLLRHCMAPYAGIRRYLQHNCKNQ